jgi:glycosyltransferase involved in cell wall biosynthesis
MMRGRRDIICLSTQYWGDAWFRKQHFMSRLVARGHRVLYVQPSFSMVRQPTLPGLAHNRWLRPRIEHLSDRLTLFFPPRFLPKVTNRWVSTLNYHWFGALIAREAARLGFRDTCLWIYWPEYVAALGRIPHSTVVFDLVDDLAGYDDRARRSKFVAGCITRLVAKADLTIVTSPTLVEKVRGRTRQWVLVPNGFDERLFSGESRSIPSELAELPRPIIGFVGTLFGFLDYDLLASVARAMPAASFVFVGRVYGESAQRGVERLRALPNTYFTGSKPQSEIPSYISGFDVCINPFKVDDVSRAVSPLKVYEYLACGKPVVSTPMEGLASEDAGRFVRFASADQFVSALRESLSLLDGSGAEAARAQAAQAFSWTNRFATLEPHLSSVLGS